MVKRIMIKKYNDICNDIKKNNSINNHAVGDNNKSKTKTHNKLECVTRLV